MLWGCFFYDRVRIEETMDAEKYRAILSENLLLSAQKAPRRTRKRQKKNTGVASGKVLEWPGRSLETLARSENGCALMFPINLGEA